MQSVGFMGWQVAFPRKFWGHNPPAASLLRWRCLGMSQPSNYNPSWLPAEFQRGWVTHVWCLYRGNKKNFSLGAEAVPERINQQSYLGEQQSRSEYQLEQHAQLSSKHIVRLFNPLQTIYSSDSRPLMKLLFILPDRSISTLLSCLLKHSTTT